VFVLLCRQLTEKHQVLMRKYDQESKALKRLSMNNEELAWRLSMGSGEGEGGSGGCSDSGFIRSPINSDDVAVVTRLRSPSQRSSSGSTCTPLQPLHVRASSLSSSCQPQPPSSPVSPRQKASPRTALIRTGTYEVLNKDESICVKKTEK
jgi:hypothetical protein